MARAVAQAIDKGRHLCVEAGTGTGKTLAYLLPALFSSKRVIVSTGTRNLQEQIFFKDIPFLENALGRKLSVCYMKGRSNYLCLKKLAEMEGAHYLFSPHDPEYLAAIRDWSRRTPTGDRSELTDLPDDIALWHHLDARRETCSGQKCPDFAQCFVTRIRQRALESDIVIVNHHLFFADLSLRQGDFGAVLPDYAVVIFDEAHELEDVATQYFGVVVSNYRFEEFTRDAAKVLKEGGSGSDFLEDQLERLAGRSIDFFGRFKAREGRFAMHDLGSGLDLRRGPTPDDSVSESYRELLVQVAATEAGLANIPTRSDAIDALVRRAAELQQDLHSMFESPSGLNVYWYELRGRGVFAWASPIQISSILGERLFAKVDCAILTSATLSTGGDFRFIRSRLGIEHADELIVGFAFRFCPAGDPLHPARHPRAARGGLAPRSVPPAGTNTRGQQGARLRTLHELHPNGTRAQRPARQARVPDAAAGDPQQVGPAGYFPQHAQRGPVRHQQLLAGRRRAGRSLELRRDRQTAVLGAERSGRGRQDPARERHGRERVL